MNLMRGTWSSWGMALVACALSSGCDANERSAQPDAGQPAPEPEPVEPDPVQPEPVEPEPVEPEPIVPELPEIELPVDEHLEVASVTSLDMLPAEDTLVGVTVDPTGATRFVLSEESGLFAIANDGSTLVFDTNNLPLSEFVPELPFTDVVALSNKRFALTAKNEGYLLDIEDQSLTRFFCYLPAENDPTTSTESISQLLEAQGIAVYQITQAVTHNAELGLLFAHPITVGIDDGVVYGAEVGAFSDVTGEPITWSLVQDGELQSVSASGMVADDSRILTLSHGDSLYRFDGVSNPELIESLAPHGVGEITGLAAVPGTDHILVLDGQHRQLVEFAPSN